MPRGDYPAHPLEVGQVLKIIRKIPTRRRKGVRDRAIIAVLWRCGLRNSELRTLKFEHLSSTTPRQLRVMKPKGIARGAPPRDVGIDPATWELIEKWLKLRGEGNGLLFTSNVGTQMDRDNLCRMLRSRARQGGVTRRVHAHCFRHTYAKDLLEDGVPMITIQKALGHSSLQTTAIYLSHVGNGEVVAATSERNWTL